MTFRLTSVGLWLGLLAVAFFAAPPGDPETLPLVTKMMTGQLDGVNLSLFALFNLMGVWPMLLASLLVDDPRGKWPFVLGSFALGAFALLPWLMIRTWQPLPPNPSRLARVLRSRGLRAGLVLVGVALLGLFFFGGDFAAFTATWKTNQFAFVMSFDFLACASAAGLLLFARARG